MSVYISSFLEIPWGWGNGTTWKHMASSVINEVWSHTDFLAPAWENDFLSFAVFCLHQKIVFYDTRVFIQWWLPLKDRCKELMLPGKIVGIIKWLKTSQLKDGWMLIVAQRVGKYWLMYYGQLILKALFCMVCNCLRGASFEEMVKILHWKFHVIQMLFKYTLFALSNFV